MTGTCARVTARRLHRRDPTRMPRSAGGPAMALPIRHVGSAEAKSPSVVSRDGTSRNSDASNDHDAVAPPVRSRSADHDRLHRPRVPVVPVAIKSTGSDTLRRRPDVADELARHACGVLVRHHRVRRGDSRFDGDSILARRCDQRVGRPASCRGGTTPLCSQLASSGATRRRAEARRRVPRRLRRGVHRPCYVDRPSCHVRRKPISGVPGRNRGQRSGRSSPTPARVASIDTGHAKCQ